MVRNTIQDSYKPIKIMLTLSGIWPRRNASLLYRTATFLSIILPSIQSILIRVDAYQGFPNGSYSLYAFSILLAGFISNAEISVPLFKSKAFRKVLTNLRNTNFQPSDEALQAILNKYLRFSKFLRIFLQVSYAMVGLNFIPVPDYRKCYNGKYIFDVKMGFFTIPHLHAVFIKLANLFIVWNVGCMDTLYIHFVLCTAAQLNMLQEKLALINITLTLNKQRQPENEELFGKCDNEVVIMLQSCVEHHSMIEKLIQSIEDTFSNMVLNMYLLLIAMITAVVLQVCVLRFESVEFIIAAVVLLVGTSKVFLYCLIANTVIDRSLKVNAECCMIEWNNCGICVRKMLLIMIQRSQKPFVLTAGTFFVLSRKTFLSSIYSYVAVLRRLYAKGIQ